MITQRQIRAARALLGWDAADLAEKAGLTRATLSNIENGLVQARAGTIEKIAHVFHDSGIEFLGFDGVRRRMIDVNIFEGVEGFAKFHDLVYAHLSGNGGEACVCGASATQFSKYRTDGETHRARMTQLARTRKDFRMRILAEYGDTNLPNTAYATYKWLPRENFPPVAFYSFGNYKAEITFDVENPPLIILVESVAIAKSYNKFFNMLWNGAEEPKK